MGKEDKMQNGKAVAKEERVKSTGCGAFSD